MAHERATVQDGMAVALDPQDWAVFQALSVAAMAAWLLELASHVNLRK